LEAQIKYLQTQIGQLRQEKGMGLRNSRSPMEQGPWFELEREESNPNASSSEEGEARRPFRPRERSHLDFKVNIPEFEGQLDPDHFLD